MSPTTPAPVDLAKYTALVHQQAWRCLRRLPRRSLLTEADLAQEGWLTLTKALRWYMPGKAAFSTYAYISLARRYAEIARQEHKRVTLDYALLDVSGDEDDFSTSAFDRLAADPPSQTLVETRVDFARGRWDGPALRTARQVEEARERLAVLA
jgi:hypothetical protein